MLPRRRERLRCFEPKWLEPKWLRTDGDGDDKHGDGDKHGDDMHGDGDGDDKHGDLSALISRWMRRRSKMAPFSAPPPQMGPSRPTPRAPA